MVTHLVTLFFQIYWVKVKLRINNNPKFTCCFEFKLIYIYIYIYIYYFFNEFD